MFSRTDTDVWRALIQSEKVMIENNVTHRASGIVIMQVGGTASVDASPSLARYPPCIAECPRKFRTESHVISTAAPSEPLDATTGVSVGLRRGWRPPAAALGRDARATRLGDRL